MKLRTKFTLVISILIIIVIGTNSGINIFQKYQELNQDIFRNAVNYSQLVSQDILDRYQTNTSTNTFLKLPGEVKSLLELNRDIYNVQVVSYEGKLLYDFQQEETEQYDGEERYVVSDLSLMERVQSNNPSIQTKDGTSVYFTYSEDGRIVYLDSNGTALDVPYNETQQIENVVYTIDDGASYALVYGISYELLNARIFSAATNTLILAILYIAIGVVVAFFFALRIVQPIKKLTETAKHISKGQFGQTIKIKSKDEVGTLAKSFNKMSTELKSATDELVEKEKVGKEIELASKIQEEFLPKDIPVVGGLDIQAGVISADAVGGDCYDFIKISDDKLLLYVGDVTGHGVSAGLITAIANSIVFSMSSKKEAHDPKKVCIELNTVLKEKTRPDMFITLFLGVWDGKTSSLSYTPCGHDPAYLYKSKTGEIKMLEKEGIALGMVPDISKLAKHEKVKMEKGDVLFLYTDGIPEAWSPKKEIYGFERLEASIKKHVKKNTAKDIYDGILEDVYNFMGKRPQSDDVTLVVLRKE